LRVLYDSG
jgi:DNA-binding transcriptional LysR family regulator